MRLWHEKLITKLPQQQLCGQWRECMALLGNGWGKKHSVVNYVFEHDDSYLAAFAIMVAKEMERRNYNPNWELITKALLKRHNQEETTTIIENAIIKKFKSKRNHKRIYPEHNRKYYKECIENLKEKGIEI